MPSANAASSMGSGTGAPTCNQKRRSRTLSSFNSSDSGREADRTITPVPTAGCSSHGRCSDRRASANPTTLATPTATNEVCRVARVRRAMISLSCIRMAIKVVSR